MTKSQYENQPVVAIPPSYDSSESLELHSTKRYLKYLQDKNVTRVMSTAGTSQFNLMNQDEIHDFNNCLSESFEGSKILGIPAIDTISACNFAKDTKSYTGENVKLMALYPDRFYGDTTIIKYIESICNAAGESIYVHANKMRAGTSGDWSYHSEIINKLHELGLIVGIKEEHSDLQASYNFVRNLNKELDIIVAGGSMRRYSFLESAGANSFLSGVGNLFPELENTFINGDGRIEALNIEAKMFDVFMKHGWHKSLREALKIMDLTCLHNRNPWPDSDDYFISDITNIVRLMEIEI